MLLADQIDRLAAAGLTRVNISLDTLSEDTFKTLSRRQGLNRVLEGIEACCQRGDIELKLNALVLRDVNLCDVVELVQFSRARNLQIRFIEFMPLDGSRAWSNSRMVSGQELRELIAREIGPIQPLNRPSPSAPSTDYTFADGSGRVGFIDSVSQPFCGSCDRLRLTAEGRLRNCLFGREEWDVACQLKTGAIDEAEIVNTLQACTQAKHASHGIAEPGFTPPERAMYQIGG